jgi:hypothetical protein
MELKISPERSMALPNSKSAGLIFVLVEWTRISPSGYATQVYKVLQAAL